MFSRQTMLPVLLTSLDDSVSVLFGIFFPQGYLFVDISALSM